MRFAFFGTPRFAETVLSKLIDAGFVPMAVVCNPDRPVGRKKIVTAPPVKQFIKNRGAKSEILQAEDPSLLVAHLATVHLDVSVVAAYSKILSSELVTLPRLGTIGVHPSLLPKYRGASPIQSVILNGESETGVTIYQLDEKMDHGPILAQRTFSLDGTETYLELEERLAQIGGDLLTDILPRYLAGECLAKPQDHKQATFTKKYTTKDAFVAPEALESAKREGGDSATVIYRKIRAFHPEPGAWTIRNGKRLKLLGADLRGGKLALAMIQEEGGVPKRAE
jgi:methionyl-tRNA formyltransferase